MYLWRHLSLVRFFFSFDTKYKFTLNIKAILKISIFNTQSHVDLKVVYLLLKVKYILLNFYSLEWKVFKSEVILMKKSFYDKHYTTIIFCKKKNLYSKIVYYFFIIYQDIQQVLLKILNKNYKIIDLHI